MAENQTYFDSVSGICSGKVYRISKARPAKPLEQGKNIFILDATFCNVVHLYKRNVS